MNWFRRRPADVSTESLERLRDHAAANGLDSSREHYEALLEARSRSRYATAAYIVLPVLAIAALLATIAAIAARTPGGTAACAAIAAAASLAGALCARYLSRGQK